ncbi:NAD(P)H-dependent oxidoreductase [Alicyclobacillus cycloheptanicus]|jgi:NAD(P)H-dependent FMN reductase|uniref:NAD(P)H-dependent FMN reductase n=1 Tax=Alicyclobacillus cycloheptanicus TaxID=1457 RepID=A0ABT9XI09_9BACL|nr:NADPH-dependent FMN reductase [Alicyclobacillus cycloheptanicus]MDQ0189955.1 NAD(P)H-dependent FMN reductase [Alicyclobacillus cycloheptanicus]WDM02149.1 NAD(P)H-dependent oxidoreductase [Alicyclobacillus cycloheptanicus]
MKLVALVGSLRKDSFNLHLVETMEERYKDKFAIEYADIRSLPFYDQDQEDPMPEAAKKLHQQVAAADGVLIVTPEFNWSFSGVLKNALDWLSRGDRPMNNKPTLVAGVSPFMMGTLRAQQHLRDVLVSPGIAARTLPPGGNEILITFANEKFKDGRLVDENTLAFLDSIVDKFVNLVQGK